MAFLIKALSALLSFGNRKLPKSTAISNLGPAEDCYSDKEGYCLVADICYAKNTERMYKQTVAYRRRQLEFWDSVSAEEWAAAFIDIVSRKKHRVTALRFNESGDFRSQDDFDKMVKIANYINYQTGIKVYVYTSNPRIDFSHSGSLVVIHSRPEFKVGVDAYFHAVNDAHAEMREARRAGLKAIVCPGSCKKCRMCPSAKGTGVLIFINKH